MLQSSEIGKYRLKESVFKAKAGKTFVTPENRSYIFNYRKEGRRYIIVLTYLGFNMQVLESDYNTINTDRLLEVMEKEIQP